ncbi:hypothetical protein D9758_008993 [Tetrapyrgos nigripes]|uniref:Uncharacterized protein n=1 Tax=Tetrapyrgos nigripes TaxID=182062 RepID=A0A8H5GKT6_9AGAR|nr:hypothetical protein D9758_008993 [Tetrapyrgos nigripes]
MPPALSSAYSPEGDLWIERSNFNGVVLSNVAFGILFGIAIRCLRGVYETYEQTKKIQWWIGLYAAWMLALATVALALQDKFNQMTFIDYRDYPGGPNAFTLDFYSLPVNVGSFSLYTIMAWFADGLVLYRFFIIYDRNRYILFLPALIWLGGVLSGIGLLVSIVHSDNSFWAETSIKLGIAFWSISLGLNIILTSLIAGRLLIARYHAKTLMGPRYGSHYLSVVSMLIESAALYSAWALAFLITFARGSPAQNLLLPALGQVQGIAPLLILMRVLHGRAWSNSTNHGYTQEHIHKTPLTSRNTIRKSHSGETVLPGPRTMGNTRSLIVLKDTQIERM